MVSFTDTVYESGRITETSAWWKIGGGPSGNNTWLTSSGSNLLNDYRVGTSVPDYASKIARAVDASSSYTRGSASIAGRSDGTWSVRYRYGGNLYESTKTRSGNCCVESIGNITSPIWGGVDPSDLNKLTTSFLLRVNERVAKAGLMTSVGELIQARGGLGDTFGLMRHATENYLSLVRNKARISTTFRQLGRDIRDGWLDYQLNLKPLASDVVGLLDAMNDLVQEENFEKSYVGATDTFQYQRQLTGSRWTSPNVPWQSTPRKTNWSYSVKYRYYCCFLNSILSSIAFETRLGMGMNDFVPTVWNLLPFSFIADYVVGIDAALNANLGVRPTPVYCGLTAEENGTLETFADFDTASWLALPVTHLEATQSGPDKVLVNYRSYGRASVDLASLWVVPEIKIPSIKQFANAGALASALNDTYEVISKRHLR